MWVSRGHLERERYSSELSFGSTEWRDTSPLEWLPVADRCRKLRRQMLRTVLNREVLPAPLRSYEKSFLDGRSATIGLLKRQCERDKHLKSGTGMLVR